MQELKQANNPLEEINTLLKAAKLLVEGISVDLVKNHCKAIYPLMFAFSAVGFPFLHQHFRVPESWYHISGVKEC